MNVLYLGDDTLAGAASYLAGIMTHLGIRFDHVESGSKASALIDRGGYDLFVLSDYPARNLSDRDFARIVAAVESGAGLLMIGGWESYRGAGGDYDSTPVAAALPVAIGSSDDRVNWAGPCVIRCVTDHPALGGLSFDPAPLVGGFNRLTAKPEATVVLEVDRYSVTSGTKGAGADGMSFDLIDSSPLLVVGTCGAGRATAWASDVAPHWVGGFVDWGSRRVAVADDRFAIEVGDSYVAFFGSLLAWTSSSKYEPSGGT